MYIPHGDGTMQTSFPAALNEFGSLSYASKAAQAASAFAKPSA